MVTASYSSSDISSQNGVSEKDFIVDLTGFCSFRIEKICQHKKSVGASVASTVFHQSPAAKYHSDVTNPLGAWHTTFHKT